MGAIAPSKMPKAKTVTRKDAPNKVRVFKSGGLTPPNPGNLAGKYSTMPTGDLQSALEKAQAAGNKPLERALTAEQDMRTKLGGRYAKGGSTSKVNEAGNYTKPGMRKSLFEKIKGQAVQGTAAGQWSARKAQLLAKQYKAKGGGYKG